MPRKLPKIRTSAPPLSVLLGATGLCLATVRQLSAGMSRPIPHAGRIRARVQEARARVGAACAALADRMEKAFVEWVGDPQPTRGSSRRPRRHTARLVVVPTRDVL